jgi:quinol monooxygenase YgiN
MVLYVMKFDIHPDKVDAYLKWAKGVIKCELAHPGVVEFRAYRSVTGDPTSVCLI